MALKNQAKEVIFLPKNYKTSHVPVFFNSTIVNPIQMGIFRATHGWGEGKKAILPKICHTYPITMKLGTVIPYLKKTQKITESRDTPSEFWGQQHFFYQRLANFVLSRNTDIN